MGVYYDFDEVDAFTIGAVGRPGQRMFMFQARRGRERVTVKCEKQQAAAIADYLRKLLNDLPPPDDRPMPWSSNATFLVDITMGDRAAKAIYKPQRGERPLWDFEPGLHRRELAAYRLSEAMDIDLVPPTVIRDGPLGEGSLQWFVDADH